MEASILSLVLATVQPIESWLAFQIRLRVGDVDPPPAKQRDSRREPEKARSVPLRRLSSGASKPRSLVVSAGGLAPRRAEYNASMTHLGKRLQATRLIQAIGRPFIVLFYQSPLEDRASLYVGSAPTLNLVPEEAMDDLHCRILRSGCEAVLV